MGLRQIGKKVGDGKTVTLHVGTGEALSGVQEEEFREITVAEYDSLVALRAWVVAFKAAVAGAGVTDIATLKAAVAGVATPTLYLDAETGL